MREVDGVKPRPAVGLAFSCCLMIPGNGEGGKGVTIKSQLASRGCACECETYRRSWPSPSFFSSPPLVAGRKWKTDSRECRAGVRETSRKEAVRTCNSFALRAAGVRPLPKEELSSAPLSHRCKAHEQRPRTSAAVETSLRALPQTTKARHTYMIFRLPSSSVTSFSSEPLVCGV